jgi:rubredoxin
MIVSRRANLKMTERINMKIYQCIVCGFIYDEAVGMPEDGIAAGTKWDDIPADWACPDCGVAKADFEMVQI